MDARIINQETQQLYELFAACAPGELITYEAMTQHIKRDVRGCLWFVQSARRQIKKTLGVVFGAVPNVGIRRLNDSEIVLRAPSYLKKVRRASKRGVEELACVQDFTKLTREEMIQHQTAASALGTIHQALMQPSLKRLRGAVQVANAELPSPSVLDAWK